MSSFSLRYYKQWANHITLAALDVVYATNVSMECPLLLMSTIKYIVSTIIIKFMHQNVLDVVKVSFDHYYQFFL